MSKPDSSLRSSLRTVLRQAQDERECKDLNRKYSSPSPASRRGELGGGNSPLFGGFQCNIFAMVSLFHKWERGRGRGESDCRLGRAKRNPAFSRYSSGVAAGFRYALPSLRATGFPLSPGLSPASGRGERAVACIRLNRTLASGALLSLSLIDAKTATAIFTTTNRNGRNQNFR
jgi:hypothetical protein